MIEFVPMTAGDLVLFHEWLQRPHVRRWWRDRETYEEVVEHYLPSIEGHEPTDHYLIVLDDRPIGVIQTYLVSDYPEWGSIVEMGDDVAGVDLAIGEENLVGRGLGPLVLSQFARDIVLPGRAPSLASQPSRRGTAVPGALSRRPASAISATSWRTACPTG